MTFKPKVLIPVLLTLAIPASAQFRKYSNEFLNIGAGARGLAMGSAQIASVQDGTAGYWNPAGLTGVKDYGNANLMHAEYFAGIGKYDYASLAFPLAGNKRTIGITGLRFAVDEEFIALSQKAADENYKPLVSVKTKKLNDSIQIIVADNGLGIPQKVVDKIFQPFFTTKPTGQGTGLGLSLSYDIIKAHRGEIKVETKENEGSEFIIRLP